MTEINRTTLFNKLNELGYKSIESATLFCKMRGNPYVELVHWLHQILQQSDSDLHRLLRHFDVDSAKLAKDLTTALDRLPRGATSISDLSIHVEESVERGWVYGSLMFGATRVRTGHLVIGWLKTPSLRNALGAISKEFSKLKADTVADDFVRLTDGSPEALAESANVAGAKDGSSMAPAVMGKQEALAKFSVDLTERAKQGAMDPILGRDDEIRQIIHVLQRRRQNNPILTGEAGVGKTAVVEGLAQRIASGDVPPALKNVRLRTLDVGLLQAGASMKGEFENRLRQVIEEVQSSSEPIVLFIDEAHTLVGAGGAQGTGDAANLLKPALARGSLRTIAATTWAEYKKHIENDPALTRRFQVVKVEEPSEEKALLMMRGIASALEQHHRVQLLDEALDASVKLSKRYIPDRQLPDKSVSLLDTACARVAISQHAVPPEVEHSRRRIEALEAELAIIGRERSIGIDVGTRSEDVEASLATERETYRTVEAKWQSEKALVDRMLALRAELRAPGESQDDSLREQRLFELKGLEAELAQLQGDDPLIFPTVDAQAVAAVVAEWTGIPTGRMVKNEIETVLKLADHLGKRVIGQGHALEMIARRVETARAGLENPNKPIGVFMLAGPSGVGKTETALALAEALYGGEQNVITINMSEFQEAHTVSTLKGAPPGYVGYGEGGVLTEAVRRRPYSVVLLDEIEKAHSDVHELFFQVFDKGFMEDGQGTRVDFKNTIVLLTSNVGSEVIAKLCEGSSKPDPNMVTEALRGPLLQVFPAALLGRMVVIPYFALSDEMLGNIVRLQLDRVKQRVQARYSVPFSYDEAVVQLISSRCTELESGGRAIDAVLTNSLLPELSRELLLRTLSGNPVERVRVGVSGAKFEYGF
ncbi:MAG TPA: type VI secretion system ATPase TssH [Polyangiaceae bacterium]